MTEKEREIADQKAKAEGLKVGTIMPDHLPKGFGKLPKAPNPEMQAVVNNPASVEQQLKDHLQSEKLARVPWYKHLWYKLWGCPCDCHPAGYRSCGNCRQGEYH